MTNLKRFWKGFLAFLKVAGFVYLAALVLFDLLYIRYGEDFVSQTVSGWGLVVNYATLIVVGVLGLAGDELFPKAHRQMKHS